MIWDFRRLECSIASHSHACQGRCDYTKCINFILTSCRALEVQSLVQAQIRQTQHQYDEREIHQSKALQALASSKLDSSNMKQIRKYLSRIQCRFQCIVTSARSYHQHHQKWTLTAC